MSGTSGPSPDAYDCQSPDRLAASRKDMVNAMEAKVAKVTDSEAELPEIKRMRNSLLPVGVIPPEVLSEIFLFFRGMSIPPITHHWPGIPWMSVTHVSSHWRVTALNDPRLWVTLNLRFPRLVAHMLQYSAARPLTLMLHAPETAGIYAETEEILADDKPRSLEIVRSISNPIVGIALHSGVESQVDVMGYLEHLMHVAGPHLLSFEMSLRHRGAIAVMENTAVPKLQKLSFRRVSISLGCTLLESCARSLRELTLRDCEIDDWVTLHWCSFVCLESLSLRLTCMFDGDEELLEIQMPSTLRLLYIEDAAPICLTACQAMKVPAGCHVLVCSDEVIRVMTTKLDELDLDELDDLCSYFSSDLPKAARAHITEDFVELQYEPCEPGHTMYTLRLPYGYTLGALDALSILVSSNTAELSITCEQHADLYRDPEFLQHQRPCRSVRLLKVGGGKFLDDLSSFLSKNNDFLPDLEQLQVCHTDLLSFAPMQVQKCRDAMAARSVALVPTKEALWQGNAVYLG